MFPKPKRTDHSSTWSEKASQKKFQQSYLSLSGSRSNVNEQSSTFHLFSKSFRTSSHKPFCNHSTSYLRHLRTSSVLTAMLWRVPQMWGGTREIVDPDAATQVFWTLPVSTIWGHLFVFKLVAEKILGGNDWLHRKNSCCKVPNTSI